MRIKKHAKMVTNSVPIEDQLLQRLAVQALQEKVPSSLTNIFQAELIRGIIDAEAQRFLFRNNWPSFDESLPGFERMPQFLARALFIQKLPLIDMAKKRECVALGLEIGTWSMLGGIGGSIGGLVGSGLVLGAIIGGWEGVLKGLFIGGVIGVVLSVILGAVIGIAVGLTARLARGVTGVLMAVLGAVAGAFNGVFYGILLKFLFFPETTLGLMLGLAAGVGAIIGAIINIIILALAAIIKNPNPSVGRGQISSQNWQEAVAHYADYFPLYLQSAKDCVSFQTSMEADLRQYHLNNLSLIFNPLDAVKVRVLENFMITAVLLHKISENMQEDQSPEDSIKYGIAAYKVGKQSVSSMKKAFMQTHASTFFAKSASNDARLKKKKLGFDVQDTVRYVYEVYELAE